MAQWKKQGKRVNIDISKHRVTEVVYLITIKPSIALFMLVMFITPIATPLSQQTEIRVENPRYTTSNLLLDGGGSVYNATIVYVQNATHTINVDVANYGTSSKDVIVFVYHKGSPLSNENLVASKGHFSGSLKR